MQQPQPASTDGAPGVRINKCFRAVSSRREADALVAAGRVRVNGVVAAAGARVQPGDVVKLDGVPVLWESLQVDLADSSSGSCDDAALSGELTGEEAASSPLPLEASFLYIAYWKPPGVVCTTDARIPGGLAPLLRSIAGLGAAVSHRSAREQSFASY